MPGESGALPHLYKSLLVREIENPYQSPDAATPSGGGTKFPRTSRLRFLYVVALIIAASSALTLLCAQRYDASHLQSLQLFGLTVAGPFMTLLLLVWEPGPLTIPILGVAATVFLVTTSYLIRPNNFTLGLSLIGGLAWAMIVPVIVFVLPELHIRI